MRFEAAYSGWHEGRLTQEEAARVLGVCERSFRRYVSRFEADGLDGLIDRRLEQVSHRRAPVDEVMALTERYRTQHGDWNVKHFPSGYQREGGTRRATPGSSSVCQRRIGSRRGAGLAPTGNAASGHPCQA